jgi:hypothetical protein
MEDFWEQQWTFVYPWGGGGDVMPYEELRELYYINCKAQIGKGLENAWQHLFTPWPQSASELYRPSDRRLLAKLVPTFADKEYRVVSAADPYGRILIFQDRSRYFYFQVAAHLYSRGWVDPVPDPLLLRKSCRAGNRTPTSGSVARNSDH